MTTDSEKKTFLAKNQPPAIELDKTICIEWFRLGSFIALASLFVAAKIFSSKFVFYPDEDLGIGSRSLLSSLTDKVTSFLPEGEESGRFLSSLRGAVASATATGEEGRNLGDTGSFVLFGQEHPYINMRETVIFKTFGLPHTCSYIDFNPAKEIGAILLPLFSFPMTVFLILAHYRNQLVYVNDPQNEEAKSLYKFSRFATYFSVIVIQLTHLWFVNDPQESYPKAVGFVGHYIPYALFQTALVVIAMMQVKYDIVTKSIPYGVSKGMARFYVVYLGILTFVYQAVVVAVLMDNPIIDARNGGWEATVFQILVKLYALSSLLVPIACSVWTIRHSGDTNSFKMAMAKNVFPAQGSDDIFNTIKSFVMGKSAIIVSLGVFIVGATFALTGSSPHPDIPSSIESSAVEVEGPILEHWPPSLHTLFNLAPPHPVTTAAASEAGWVKIDDPCNPLLGEAWLLQGERARNSSATLYFSPEVEGTPGHVTGIEVDYYGYIEDKLVGTYFSEAKTAKDGTYHSVSLALRDSEKYDLCDTKKPLAGGNDAYVAIGPDMANTMVPSTETDPELESSWKEGSCLHGMGTHWFSDAVSGKDLTLKTENTVPIVPMYNSFGDKKISGVFFMATERKQNWDFEACPIEGSPKEAVACNCFVHKNCNFWDKSPGLLEALEPPFYMCANMCGDCAFSGTKDGYFTTMHWFFHDAAATVSCPGGKFCREGAGEAH